MNHDKKGTYGTKNRLAKATGERSEAAKNMWDAMKDEDKTSSNAATKADSIGKSLLVPWMFDSNVVSLRFVAIRQRKMIQNILLE